MPVTLSPQFQVRGKSLGWLYLWLQKGFGTFWDFVNLRLYNATPRFAPELYWPVASPAMAPEPSSILHTH